MYSELPESSPENVIAAPKGSVFTRVGENFYLTTNGILTKLNLPKKSFALKYKNEVWYEGLKNEIITFKTNGETWRKISGTGKKGWAKISNKTTIVRAIEPIIVNLGDMLTVAAGYYYSYFLKRNGELWTAGGNWDGQLGIGSYDDSTASLALTDVKMISTPSEGYHGIAVKNDGTLWMAGANWSGQLGNGTYDSSTTFIQIEISGSITGSSVISEITGGENYSALLMGDGTLWYTGDEWNDTSAGWVQLDSNVKNISGGGYHLLYVKNDDTLWGVGYNGQGQLGIGNETDQSSPVQIDTNVSRAFAGGYHTAYIKNDNTLWTVGANWDGQLGVGDTNDRNVSTQVDTDVLMASGGDSHTLYIKNDKTMYGMGYNGDGELGLIDDSDVLTPVQLLTNVKYVSAGGYHSLFIKENGDLYGMGGNWEYELGFDGTIKAVYYTEGSGWQITTHPLTYFISKATIYADGKFVSVGYNNAGTNVLYSVDGINWQTGSCDLALFGVAYGSGSFVATNNSSKIAVSSDGINWTTSSIADENLGLDKIVYGNGQFVASGLSTYEYFYPGYYIFNQRIVTSTDGNVWQIRTGSLSDRLKAFAYGEGKYVGIQESALSGEISTNQTIPIKVFSGSINNTSVSIGGSYDIFILHEGTLYAAGYNQNGEISGGYIQSGQNYPFKPVATDVKVATSTGYATIYVKNDNTVWAIGGNGWGELAQGYTGGPNALNPIQITASFSGSSIVALGNGERQHIWALTEDGKVWGWGYNGFGETSPDIGTPVNVPYPMNGQTFTASMVSAAVYHTLVVDTNKNLWGIGRNSESQLTSSGGPYTSPVLMDTNVVSASGVGYSTIYLKSDGTLWGRGSDFGGSAVQIATNAIDCMGGFSSYYYLKEDGTLYSKGYNWYGQLGLGDTLDRNTFEQVDTNVVKIFKPDLAFAYIKNDGSVYMMGYNANNRMGFDAQTSPLRKGEYSSDGITWNLTRMNNYSMEFDMAYGNGRFVAPTGYGKSLYSDDGINWLTGSIVNRVNNTPWLCKTTAFDGTNFVTIGNQDAAYTSADGETWQSSSMNIGSGIYYNSISAGDNKYVGFVSPGDAPLVSTPKKLTIG